ncbi:MAG TPA: cache domain-containing protein, partial [Spirochaetia bacterium]|nr:cache domain-containing protein [Spirochaetia bacterium]
LAKRPEAVVWNPPAMLDEARRLTAAFPEVHALVFANREGQVVVDTIAGRADLAGLGGNVGDREYFREARAGRSVVTDVILARTSGRPSLIIAEPVMDPAGRVIGVGFAVVRPAAIERALSRTGGTAGVNTFILDSNGVLATSEDAGKQIGPEQIPPAVGTSVYTSRLGTRVYGRLTTIDRAGWTVVSELDESSVTATLLQYNRILARWVIAALLVTVVLAIAVAATIQVPVRHLGRLAAAIRASGRTDPRVVPGMRHAPVELRNLRHGLVTMAEVIEARQSDLARSNELLRATQEVAHVGSWEYIPGSGEFACSDELLRIAGLPVGRDRLSLKQALDLLHPDDRSVIVRRFRESLASGEVGFEIEHRLRVAGSEEDRFVLHRASHVRGGPDRRVHSRGTMYDITDRHRAEESLRIALAEKSILLHEVHHRVRNNLAIVESILSLQRDRLPAESRAYRALADAHSRILAMGLLHRYLYETENLLEIQLNDYALELITILSESYGAPGIEVTSVLDEAVLNVSTAIPCGLILNELIVNAYKHAFPSGSGTLEVRVQKRQPGEIEIAVIDDGIGVDQARAGAGQNVGGLGTELTRSLVEQLGGSVSYSDAGGTTVVVRFPLRD